MIHMKRILCTLGLLWSLSAVVGPAYAAATVPPEVSAVSKLLNPGGYFEIQPGAGVRYPEASLKAEPVWYVGAKVLASPRKWLNVDGKVMYDVPGHNKPRMEASTWIRF